MKAGKLNIKVENNGAAVYIDRTQSFAFRSQFMTA